MMSCTIVGALFMPVATYSADLTLGYYVLVSKSIDNQGVVYRTWFNFLRNFMNMTVAESKDFRQTAITK